jgi:bile acid-coenzyme A ligase
MMSRIWRLPAEQRDAYNLSSLRLVFHLAAPCPRCSLPALAEGGVDRMAGTGAGMGAVWGHGWPGCHRHQRHGMAGALRLGGTSRGRRKGQDSGTAW